MTETLAERLDRKLAQAFCETWPRRNAISAELDPDTRFETTTGVLSGGIAFRVRDAKGIWQTIHRERISNLRSAEELDDFLAAGLSRFLMKHPEWPR